MPSRRTVIPSVIRPLVRSCYHKFHSAIILAAGLADNKITRNITFNTSSGNSLLISHSDETFVVSAADKVIGKYTYIRKQPFDFRKLESAISLIPRHKKILLIDIGANIGTICIPAIKRGFFKQAIAIEPGPANYSLLMANIYLNSLQDKICAHNIALGQNNEEILNFELCPFNHGDHHIATEGATNTVPIRSETLDKIAGNLSADEAFIFIDTQGYEGFIFAGAAKALRNKVPICLEFWPKGMERSGGYALLKRSLLSYGYTQFYNLDNPIGPIPLTKEALDTLYSSLLSDNAMDKAGTFYTDLLVL